VPSVVDDAGRTVALPAVAQRIVSLAPHATELLFAVGAGAQIVGADEYSDYPLAAKAIPRIGRAGALDVERIIALKPDLIVAWGSGNTGGQVAQLQRFKLNVFSSEPRSPADVASTLRRLGGLSGHEAAAEKVATDFEVGLTSLQQQFSGRTNVTVFYQIWHEPLQTINREHNIAAVIRMCGGQNVFDSLPTLAPTLAREAVLRADPQVILGSGSDGQRPQWLDDWRRWPQLRAVKYEALYDIPPDLMQRPTPRLLEGAKRVCAALDEARSRQAGR
jgi:iron complex transport system substrate-binding protein